MSEEELLAECEKRFEYSDGAGGLVGKLTDYRFRLTKGKRVGNTHHSGYKYVKINGKLLIDEKLSDIRARLKQ
jgi:hypothetical protein